MNNLDKKIDFLEEVNYFYKYRKLAEEGKLIEALEFNGKAYGFFYEMYVNERTDKKFKAKIQLALEKITADGEFIQTQLNKWENLCTLN